jgi:DNA-binding HxlR family transcriptional regulator
MERNERWQATWHGLHDILGPKWALHVLRVLSTDARGFNAIKNELDGLTAPVLSTRLKELRCHGLVERTVENTSPPTTTYSLTPRGAEIAAHLRRLESLVDLQPAGCSDAPGDCRGQALEDGCVTVGEYC